MLPVEFRNRVHDGGFAGAAVSDQQDVPPLYPHDMFINRYRDLFENILLAQYFSGQVRINSGWLEIGGHLVTHW